MRERPEQAAWKSFRKGRSWCQYFAVPNESCCPSLVCVGGAFLEHSTEVTCAFLSAGIKSPHHSAEACSDGTTFCPQLDNSEE